MMTTRINIAKQFYDAPVGRFPSDGDYNGQRFRDEFLVPALQNSEHVLVDMDGTDGYGSSFLEEAFGGLVRVRGFTAADLRSKLSLKSDEDLSFIEEVWEYIETAKPDNVT
ncbi:STAS-like domain-containing protein [Herbaspirillum seropedicae]|uniref:STAS-like domain-containing protein n=1 Tax=Herbaspirillum seropedicae TaxID=964 RepID=UPI003D96EB09